MPQRTTTTPARYIGRPVRLLVDGRRGVIVDHNMATGRADVRLDDGARVNLAACQLQFTGEACPATWQGADCLHRCALGAGHAPASGPTHGHLFTIRTIG